MSKEVKQDRMPFEVSGELRLVSNAIDNAIQQLQAACAVVAPSLEDGTGLDELETSAIETIIARAAGMLEKVQPNMAKLKKDQQERDRDAAHQRAEKAGWFKPLKPALPAEGAKPAKAAQPQKRKPGKSRKAVA